jgi:hypothetical protein
MDTNEKLNKIVRLLCETKGSIDNFSISNVFDERIESEEARYLVKKLISDGVVRRVNIYDNDEYISIEYIFETKLFFDKGGYRNGTSTVDNVQEINIIETSNKSDFINYSIINNLETLSASGFDLSRLVAICKELNIAFRNECYISVIMLSRALIDHIPPIFGQESFKNVYGNYGNRSFKEHMSHLDNSMRKIADSYLHSHIRRKESIPTINQVNFSPDIDVLLSELIRKIKENQ